MMASAARKDSGNWDLRYTGFSPAEETLRETLCTVGNGYFGTRGCIECEKAGETHYPGTYLAGLYNRLPSTVHGREIFNDDFVNCPNWLLIELQVGRGRFTSPFSFEILEYEQVLHLREALAAERRWLEQNWLIHSE